DSSPPSPSRSRCASTKPAPAATRSLHVIRSLAPSRCSCGDSGRGRSSSSYTIPGMPQFTACGWTSAPAHRPGGGPADRTMVGALHRDDDRPRRGRPDARRPDTRNPARAARLRRVRMRAATLTIEPAASALHVRLDVPERDVGEALVREFRQRVDAATLRALEESAGTLFHGRARFAEEARRTGTALYRTLVPEGLRDDLRAVRAPLVVASSLTGIPWELVHDGDEFWGLRYALGTRLVLDRSATVRPATRG